MVQRQRIFENTAANHKRNCSPGDGKERQGLRILTRFDLVNACPAKNFLLPDRRSSARLKIPRLLRGDIVQKGGRRRQGRQWGCPSFLHSMPDSIMNRPGALFLSLFFEIYASESWELNDSGVSRTEYVRWNWLGHIERLEEQRTVR